MPTTTSVLSAWIEAFDRAVNAHADELTALDSEIGDADHGTNMVRGMDAAQAKQGQSPSQTPQELLKAVGMTLVSTVGGASGPLYGTFFIRAATALGTEQDLDPVLLGAAVRAGVDGVMARGQAQPGDKTMVDALLPAAQAWEDAAAAGGSLAACARDARAAAERGRDATGPMRARKGRASYLGERSVGPLDPGAASSALLFEALDDAVAASS